MGDLLFESRTQPLISRRQFARRMLRCFASSLVLVAIALGIGTLGYHLICDLRWLDAFYNASMILTGMGPVAEMKTDAAKLFASFYALFSGIVFLGMMAMMLAPVAHRLLHRFHIDDDEEH
jgi:hypothetical protein